MKVCDAVANYQKQHVQIPKSDGVVNWLPLPLIPDLDVLTNMQAFAGMWKKSDAQYAQIFDFNDFLTPIHTRTYTGHSLSRLENRMATPSRHPSWIGAQFFYSFFFLFLLHTACAGVRGWAWVGLIFSAQATVVLSRIVNPSQFLLGKEKITHLHTLPPSQ